MNRSGVRMVFRAGIAAAAFGAVSFGLGSVVLADDRPKGPNEDGTKPALTRIAGEGMMNSHAFEYLSELSDDIGARVTGSPAEHKAEEWSAAKMKAIGLENVHLEKYTIWKGWTRGTAEAQPACGRNGLDRFDDCRGSGRRCDRHQSF